MTRMAMSCWSPIALAATPSPGGQSCSAPAVSRGSKGVLLVAPPDVDLPDADPRIARFGPTPAVALPCPALLVASRDDSYASIERASEMAALWGAFLVDVGDLGHINAASGLGNWNQGQQLLSILTGDIRSDCTRAVLADRVAAVSRLPRSDAALGRADSGGAPA